MMVQRLHQATPMRGRRQGGFTMIELMITVVIVGILAAVAVVAYRRNIQKARASEVPAMFQEMKAKEEAYSMEFGRYLGMCNAAMPAAGTADTGCVETDFFPAVLTTNTQMDISGTKPARWTALRIQASKSSLYCQYVVVAGPAGVISNMGTVGVELFNEYASSTPPRNWYYLLAQCDWDNNSAVNAIYSMRGDKTDLYKSNEQR
jgi:prepilin-type N-terminal cleavage/methylation domain-containing protein